MNWEYAQYALAPAASSILALAVALAGWRRRLVRGALVLSAASLIIAFVCVAYAVEILCVDMAAKLFWYNLK